MAEFYKLRPVFCGDSSLDQMKRICKILGAPSKEEWPEGHRLAELAGFTFPKAERKSISAIVPDASEDALDLMHQMLELNPSRRPSISELKKHPFFKKGRHERKKLFKKLETKTIEPKRKQKNSSLPREFDEITAAEASEIPQQNVSASGARMHKNHSAVAIASIPTTNLMPNPFDQSDYQKHLLS